MTERRLALIITNYEYKDIALRQLVTPARDAEDLAQVLRDPAIGGFHDVITRINETSYEVRRAIARLLAQKNRDDLSLLYFSGHGLLDEQGHLYLAVKDTERDLLSATAVSAAFITREMDRSRSRRQVLILDCCHSGAFGRTKGGPGDSVGTKAIFEGTGYGRWVLTATDSTQYAWEGDKVIGEADNSVFTHYLIQGLRTGEADANANGSVTLNELYDYVYEKVVSETPLQTPKMWTYGQKGNIIIAQNPRVGSQLLEQPHKPREEQDEALGRSSPQRLMQKVPVWRWVVGAIIVFALLFWGIGVLLSNIGDAVRTSTDTPTLTAAPGKAAEAPSFDTPAAIFPSTPTPASTGTPTLIPTSTPTPTPTNTPAPSDTPAPIPISTEEPLLTYYTAKQAFARLHLYLREHEQTVPKSLWLMMPSQTALYYSEESGNSGLVGGWAIHFEDELGRTWVAQLTSWGEVTVEEADLSLENFPRAVASEEWVLDNTDAHQVVLDHGGEGTSQYIGGWLRAMAVADRGIRPVWAGATWWMPELESFVMVDAETGELYQQTGEEQLQPVFETLVQAAEEWDGGFDESSDDAVISRVNNPEWWPWAYRAFDGQHVYNRKDLRAAVEEEETKPDRDASSWVTSAVLHVILGEWTEAIDDFDESLKLEPGNKDYRYYRGLYYLYVRDLEKATSDFQTLSEDVRSEALENVAIVGGKKGREGITRIRYNLQINLGMVPWVVQIGPVPLTRE